MISDPGNHLEHFACNEIHIGCATCMESLSAAEREALRFLRVESHYRLRWVARALLVDIAAKGRGQPEA